NNSNPPGGPWGPWQPQATMQPPPMTPYGVAPYAQGYAQPPHVGAQSHGYASHGRMPAAHAPAAYGSYGPQPHEQLAHPYNSAYGSAPPRRGYAPQCHTPSCTDARAARAVAARRNRRQPEH